MDDSPDVTIVGAGIAGLVTAIHLGDRGLNVHLLERGERLGGSGLGHDHRVPGVREAQRRDFTFDGYWSNGRNFNRLLNRMSGRRLKAGLPLMMPVSRILVVRADRLKDERGRLAGPPGLREYDNFVLVDEPLVSELWGLASLRSVHPYKLSWAGRMARVVNFLMGFGGGAALLWLGWLLQNPDRLLALARKDRGYRLLAAALCHKRPLWLDEWTLDQFLRASPFPGAVADWITLFQKLLNQPPPDRTSARHAASTFDFFAMRAPGSTWWQMPVKSDDDCVVQPLEERATRLDSVTILRQHGVERFVGFESDGVPFRVGGEEKRAKHLVVAAGVEGTRALMRTAPSAPSIEASLERQELSTIRILHVWFKKRIRMFERFATPIAMLNAWHVGCPFDLIWVSSKWQRDHYQSSGDVFGFQISEPQRFNHLTDVQLLERVLGWAFRMFPELRMGTALSSILDHHLSEPVTYVGGGLGLRNHAISVDPLGDGGPPLFLCGDWIRQEGGGMAFERACVTGIEAANRILQRLGKEPWPILKPPRPTRLQKNAQWVTDMVEDEARPLEPPWRSKGRPSETRS